MDSSDWSAAALSGASSALSVCLSVCSSVGLAATFRVVRLRGGAVVGSGALKSTIGAPAVAADSPEVSASAMESSDATRLAAAFFLAGAFFLGFSSPVASSEVGSDSFGAALAAFLAVDFFAAAFLAGALAAFLAAVFFGGSVAAMSAIVSGVSGVPSARPCASVLCGAAAGGAPAESLSVLFGSLSSTGELLVHVVRVQALATVLVGRAAR